MAELVAERPDDEVFPAPVFSKVCSSGSANDDGKPAKAAKPKKPKAKVEGQREMLLPIAGGKAEAEAKPAKAPRRKAG